MSLIAVNVLLNQAVDNLREAAWIACHCADIESWNIPESGCPACDDKKGGWEK